MLHTIHDYISHYKLKPHPEGGYYAETYRSAGSIALGPPFNGPRNWSTAIYFLLEAGNFSALHRIHSDEIWHFYAGDTVEIMEIDDAGALRMVSLGSNVQAGELFQYVVKAGVWFGSRVKAGGSFALTGCTVSPGFDFADFEMAKRSDLTGRFPQHRDAIAAMTRD